jgi:hypothetical protein
MLDNLKLGYGGTKTEMERLIADAAKLSETVDAQSLSFDNVVKAIHVMQDELGITGTTAKEAGTTISGSISSMKAAWENLKVGIADENADIGQLFDDLVVSITVDGSETNLGVMGNLLPRVKQVFKGMRGVAEEAAPYIAKAGDFIVDKFVEKLENPEGLFDFLDGAIAIVSGVTDEFEDDGVVAKIGNGAKAFITNFGSWFKNNENLKDLKDSSLAIIEELVGDFSLDDALLKLTNGAIGIVNNISKGISDNSYNIGKGIGDLINAIKVDINSEDWNAVGESVGTKIIGGIKKAFSGIFNLFGAGYYSVASDLDTDYFDRKIAEAEEKGASAEEIQKLIDQRDKNLADYEKEMEKHLNNTPSGLLDFFGGLSDALYEPEQAVDLNTGEVIDKSKSALFGGMSPGSSPYKSNIPKEIEDYMANIPTSESVLGQSSGIVDNSFSSSGHLPARDAIQVNLDLDGETLASVLIDPLNKKAKQKGVKPLA